MKALEAEVLTILLGTTKNDGMSGRTLIASIGERPVPSTWHRTKDRLAAAGLIGHNGAQRQGRRYWITANGKKALADEGGPVNNNNLVAVPDPEPTPEPPQPEAPLLVMSVYRDRVEIGHNDAASIIEALGAAS